MNTFGKICLCFSGVALLTGGLYVTGNEIYHYGKSQVKVENKTEDTNLILEKTKADLLLAQTENNNLKIQLKETQDELDEALANGDPEKVADLEDQITTLSLQLEESEVEVTNLTNKFNLLLSIMDKTITSISAEQFDLLGLTSLGGSFFQDCKNLTSVEMSNNITSLGTGVFMNCTALNNVTISTSISTLPTQAFYKCSSLETITIPSSVKTITGMCFQSCTNLSEVIIEEGLKIINDNTFNGCSKLTTLELPSSLERMSSKSLSGSSITTLIFNSETPIEDSSFLTNATNLTTIYVPTDFIDEYKTAWTSYANLIVDKSFHLIDVLNVTYTTEVIEGTITSTSADGIITMSVNDDIYNYSYTISETAEPVFIEDLKTIHSDLNGSGYCYKLENTNDYNNGKGILTLIVKDDKLTNIVSEIYCGSGYVVRYGVFNTDTEITLTQEMNYYEPSEYLEYFAYKSTNYFDIVPDENASEDCPPFKIVITNESSNYAVGTEFIATNSYSGNVNEITYKFINDSNYLNLVCSKKTPTPFSMFGTVLQYRKSYTAKELLKGNTYTTEINNETVTLTFDTTADTLTYDSNDYRFSSETSNVKIISYNDTQYLGYAVTYGELTFVVTINGDVFFLKGETVIKMSLA